MLWGSEWFGNKRCSPHLLGQDRHSGCRLFVVCHGDFVRVRQASAKRSWKKSLEEFALR
jgi:hypothetical protein